MKTATEIRRDNLLMIEKAFGSREELCQAIGKSAKQLSQWIGRTPTRGIGDAVAREIEENLNLERGWLDHEHDPEHSARAERLVKKWLKLDEIDQQAIEKRVDMLLAIKPSINGDIVYPQSPNYKTWETAIVQDIKGRYMKIQKKRPKTA